MEKYVNQVGRISQQVVDLLDLPVENNTPILIGKSNVEHIMKRHPYEYDKYFKDIEIILEQPDYVGINPKDNSIVFVKDYEVDLEFVRVAV